VFAIAPASNDRPSARATGEAVSDSPALVDALSARAPVWLIDPIDGTKNFAQGNANFGVMIALIEAGRTRASWMAIPAAHPSGYSVVAERDGGTRIDGVRVNERRDVPAVPRGSVHTRMMPADTSRAVMDALRGTYEPFPSTGSAATEYSAIIRGEKDFVIYYRLLPWDHAPGALALTEAGGAAVHLSGEAYAPLSPNQVTIFAATRELAESIRSRLSVTCAGS